MSTCRSGATGSPPLHEKRKFVFGSIPDALIFESTASFYASGLEFLFEYPVDLAGDPHQTLIDALPTGLTNRKNSCFVNAILQPLMHVPALFRELLKLDEFSASQRLLEAVSALAKQWNSTKRQRQAAPLDASLVYDALREKFEFWSDGGQEDAHEFFCHLIDELHGQFLLVERQATDPLVPSATAARASLDWSQIAKERQRACRPQPAAAACSSIVSDLFSGQLLSTVLSESESVTSEAFFWLQINIPASDEENPQTKDLVDALRSLGDVETVTLGTNPHAKKWMTVSQLPPILCITLKTFLFSTETEDTEKVHRFLGYPLAFAFPGELLRAESDADRNVYRLFAVVYHHGKNAAGGHYTCEVSVQPEGTQSTWYRFDDENFTVTKEEDVLREKGNQSVYLLFYQKVEAGDAEALLERERALRLRLQQRSSFDGVSNGTSAQRSRSFNRFRP